jgi:hypothetical protein
MTRILSKLSYANVMSTIAIFVALGGGAYAASGFGRSGGVVNLCVTGSGSVKVLAARKRKCAKGASLVAIDQRGQRGPQGQQGPAGQVGASASASGSYAAGLGLTLSGNSFSADMTKLQARIAGSGCAADQALQSVAQSGTPTCTGLHAYSSVKGSANYLQNDTSTVVPAGNWLLIGQAQATAAAGGDTITCHLQVNSQTVDTVVQTVTGNGEYTTTPIASATTTGSSNVVQILCSGGSGQTIIGGNLTIAAIPLAALN